MRRQLRSTQTAWPWQLKPDNPAVIAAAKAYARARLNSPPEHFVNSHDLLPVGSASITPNDGGGWASPYGTNPQTITDLVWSLVNNVAKDVQVASPGKLVACMSYALYSQIPSFPLQSNILALVTTTYNYGNLTLDQQIAGFKAKGVQVGVYDYLDVYGWWHDKPMVFLDRVQSISAYYGKGVRVFTAEGGDGWASRGLTYYLAAKMLWDSNANPDALLNDFYSKAFGPAQTVMRHYWETRSKLADNASTWNSPTAIYNLVKSGFDDLAQAETLVSGTNAYLERIRQLEYYQRFLWLWYVKGTTNLSLPDLESFYTFVTKISTLGIINYKLVEPDLRTELTNRGLSAAAIDALKDATPPTTAQANTWMNEALAAFQLSR